MTNGQTDTNIDHVFDETVAPLLDGFEVKRQAALAERRKRWWICGGLVIAPAIVLSFLAAQHFELDWIGGAFVIGLVAAAAGFGSYIYADMPTSGYTDELRGTFMDAICDFIGDIEYQAENIVDFDAREFSRVGLVSKFDDEDLEDFLQGRYRNCDYKIVEAELTDEYYSGSDNNRKKTRVFRGLLLSIETPAPVEGRILIVRDKGALFNKLGGLVTSGTRVEIPHAAFEEKYEVYASSPEEALGVISPSFVDNFLKLPEHAGSDKITAAFHKKVCLIAISTSKGFLDGFSPGIAAPKLRALFHSVVDEVSLVHRIIDQLHGGGEEENVGNV